MANKTILVCNPRSGSQLLVNGIRESDCIVAPNSAEIFCTNISDMSYPDFLEDLFDKYCPINYWSERSEMSHIEKAFNRCDFFKMLYYHISDNVREKLGRYRIIHLKRKRLLCQYVSGICAKKIGWTCTERFVGRVRVSLVDFLNHVEYYRGEWAKYDCFEDRLDLFYEDGVEYNLALACEFIGVGCPDYSPATIKVVDSDLSNVIENYEELREYDIHYS